MLCSTQIRVTAVCRHNLAEPFNDASDIQKGNAQFQQTAMTSDKVEKY